MNAGDEFFFKTMDFLDPLSILYVQSSTLIKVRTSIFRKFAQSSACSAENDSKSFANCLISDFIRTNNGKICNDVTSEGFLPKNVSFCNAANVRSQRELKIFEEKELDEENDEIPALTLAANYVNEEECLRPCESATYTAEAIKIYHLGKGIKRKRDSTVPFFQTN